MVYQSKGENNYSFGKKLKALRGTLTQEQLAEELNKKYETSYNKGMISKWENDKEEPRLDSIRIIADYFNVTLDELLGLTKDDQTVNESVALYEVVNSDQSNILYIPVVGTIAAGEPILAEQYIEGHIPVLDNFLSNHKDYFYLKVKGNSMNLEFEDGSFVLVECTPTVESGQIAVVIVDGCEATVKKVILNNRFITLIPMSNDPSHQPQMFDIKKDNVNIIGRVIQALKTY